MPTSAASAFFSATMRWGEAGISAAVSVSKTGCTPRRSSQMAMSTR